MNPANPMPRVMGKLCGKGRCKLFTALIMAAFFDWQLLTIQEHDAMRINLGLEAAANLIEKGIDNSPRKPKMMAAKMRLQNAREKAISDSGQTDRLPE